MRNFTCGKNIRVTKSKTKKENWEQGGVTSIELGGLCMWKEQWGVAQSKVGKWNLKSNEEFYEHTLEELYTWKEHKGAS